jgi:hypothetical protein
MPPSLFVPEAHHCGGLNSSKSLKATSAMATVKGDPLLRPVLVGRASERQAKAQLGRTKRPRSLSLYEDVSIQLTRVCRKHWFSAKKSLFNKKEERGLNSNEVFLGGENRVVRWRVTRTGSHCRELKAYHEAAGVLLNTNEKLVSFFYTRRLC